MFQNFRPLGNNVWVKRVEEEAKTAGGLYIPDAAKSEAQTGIIMAVGTGIRNQIGELVPLQVKVGDKIFFGKYSGTKAGESFLVIKEDEILGIVE
ncbi:co-chaperone GroES [Candidatus Dependentiae bacterium]|nr:co-chaperone GroES [Candidatus Dependentiae bacterium]